MLIYVYGGPHVQLVRNTWGGAGYLWHEILAEKGYVIFSLDNRGSWGRGHAFETPIYHHMGKIELQDQLAGVKYLKSLGYVDPARIGITGGSYGGYMTLVGALQRAGRFQSGGRRCAGDRLEALRHDLHRALYGTPAGQSGRVQRFFAGESGREHQGQTDAGARNRGRQCTLRESGGTAERHDRIGPLSRPIDGVSGTRAGISDAAARMLSIQRTLEFILEQP